MAHIDVTGDLDYIFLLKKEIEVQGSNLELDFQKRYGYSLKKGNFTKTGMPDNTCIFILNILNFYLEEVADMTESFPETPEP